MAAQVPALFDVPDVVPAAPAYETRDPRLLASHVRLVAPKPTKLDDDERQRLADLLTPAVRACLRGIAKRAARRSGEDADDLEQRALEIACARVRTYDPARADFRAHTSKAIRFGLRQTCQAERKKRGHRAAFETLAVLKHVETPEHVVADADERAYLNWRIAAGLHLLVRRPVDRAAARDNGVPLSDVHRELGKATYRLVRERYLAAAAKWGGG